MAENFRDKKIEEVIRELAAKFFLEESSGDGLITVTRVKVTPDTKQAKIFFTVYPPTKEKAVFDFAKRKRAEFRHYMQENSRISRLHFIDFDIDLGEKNRQLIDNISNEDQKRIDNL